MALYLVDQIVGALWVSIQDVNYRAHFDQAIHDAARSAACAQHYDAFSAERAVAQCLLQALGKPDPIGVLCANALVRREGQQIRRAGYDGRQALLSSATPNAASLCGTVTLRPVHCFSSRSHSSFSRVSSLGAMACRSYTPSIP